MIYVYLQNNTVTMIETRLVDVPYTDSLQPLIDAKLYNGALIPFFKSVPQEIEGKIRLGWVYTEESGFHEPLPFEINPNTGEMYLPSSIKAEDFYNLMMKVKELEVALAETKLTLNSEEKIPETVLNENV